MTPSLESLRATLASYEPEMLTTLQELLRIPSIEADALPNAPFGQPNRDALDMMLNQASAWGMTTKDLEGYGGWAEFGSGEKLILILGHLDVVPVGPGWKHDPFSATIDGDYIYSRGAVDDKGPTVAAFYAARAMQELAPDLNARIRIFFGCNEESGFKCVERYAQTEEMPTFGFAPDAGWPLYNGEKGIANLIVDFPKIQGEMSILHLSGGQRPNIVIDSATGAVKVAASARAHVEEKLAKSWDKNLTFSWKGDELHVEAIGKAAHGSWPHGGDNAVIRILRFWNEIFPSSVSKPFDLLYEATHIDGSGIGIQGSDDISVLTNNLGIVEDLPSALRFTFNVRYPVTWDGSRVIESCKKKLEEVGLGWKLAEATDSKPLFFPLDHPLVKTVVDVYEAETGERKSPGVMGGGTYARALPNSVAIGTGWEGDGDAHQTDERLKVAHLYKMSRIYAHILARLVSA